MIPGITQIRNKFIKIIPDGKTNKPGNGELKIPPQIQVLLIKNRIDINMLFY